jgi:hypothetical protein
VESFVGLRHADGLKLIPLGATQPRSNHLKSSATIENLTDSLRRRRMPMRAGKCWPHEDAFEPYGNDCMAFVAVTIIRQWQT